MTVVITISTNISFLHILNLVVDLKNPISHIIVFICFKFLEKDTDPME